MINIFDQLKSFNLTENGKELLNTIPKSILFKAKKDFNRIYRFIPQYTVNSYYAICLRFCEIQKSYPDWSLASTFDINQPISSKNEKFCMRLVLKIEGHFEDNVKDLQGLKDKLANLNSDGSVPDQLLALKKAISSGRINLNGLKFLRGSFINTKPKIVHEINKYIYNIENAMIDDIKRESNGEFRNQENITCISVETVL